MKMSRMMKCMMAIALFMSIGTTSVMAQKNIDKLLEDIEKREDVNINSVIKRDPKTKHIVSIVKSYTLTGEKMLKRLIEAFEKDEAHATTAIKNMPKGKKNIANANLLFIFYKEKKKYHYSLTAKENGLINLSFIMNQENK